MKVIKSLGGRESHGQKRTFYLFKCDICGSEAERRMDVGKKALSCGCDNGHDKRIYGFAVAKTGIYKTWENMLHRCKNLKRYRHVSVCEEWKDFIVFREWALKNGYSKDLTIDRIENDGNYEPSNCEFVLHDYNSVKRRNVVLSFEEAEEIRDLSKYGYRNYKLSNIYRVSESQIRSIIQNKTWRKKYVKR